MAHNKQSDDGKSLGVLYTGNLEKRNPVTGSFKERFVVLTMDALHWFRRSEGYDLFGEERGQVMLANILSTRILDEDNTTFEIQGTDSKKRLFRAESQKECEEWVTAVRSAIKIMHDSHNSSKRGISRRASLTGIKNIDEDGNLFENNDHNDEVSVLLLSVNSTTKHTEMVIARRPEWNHVISVPGVCKGDQVVISMSNGGVVRLPYDSVVEKAEGGHPFEAPVQGVTLASSVRITVTLDATDGASGGASGGGGGVEGGQNAKSSGVIARITEIAVALTNNRAASINLVLSLMVLIACLGSLRAIGIDTSLVFTCALILSGHTINEAVKQAAKTDAKALQMVSLRVVLHEHAFTSPDAPIVSPEDEIPQRFIDGCEGDMKEARRRWDITRHWREAEGVNGILDEPQPHFQLIRAFYPHYYCGRGKDGHIIFWDRPGDFQGDQLKSRGVTMEHLLRHWLFMTEYQWQILCEGDETAKSIAVIDANGIGISDLAGSNLDFVKTTVTYANQHYPERSHVIFVINAPFFASMMWKIVKPWVHPNTQKKVRILSAKESLNGLQEHIDISQIPVYYGGQLDFGGKDSCRFSAPEVLAWNDYVQRLNDKHATHVPFAEGGNSNIATTPPGVPGEVPTIYTQPSNASETTPATPNGKPSMRRQSTMQQRQAMAAGASPRPDPGHGGDDWSVTTGGDNLHNRSPAGRSQHHHHQGRR